MNIPIKLTSHILLHSETLSDLVPFIAATRPWKNEIVQIAGKRLGRGYCVQSGDHSRGEKHAVYRLGEDKFIHHLHLQVRCHIGKLLVSPSFHTHNHHPAPSPPTPELELLKEDCAGDCCVETITVPPPYPLLDECTSLCPKLWGSVRMPVCLSIRHTFRWLAIGVWRHAF